MNLERELHKTKMTRFLCMELLYEYVSHTLDPAREKDIEAYLPKDREAQREFERLKRAIVYTQKASHASVTETLHEALLSFEPQWQKSMREWTRWGSQRGWRLLPYIFALTTITVGLIVTKPWETAEIKEVTLAQETKEEKAAPEVPATNIAVPAVNPALPAMGADSVASPPTATPPSVAGIPAVKTAPAVAGPATVAPSEAAPAPVAQMPKIAPPNSQALPKPSPVVAPSETPAEAAAKETAKEEATPAPPVTKGEVRKATIEVSDFETNWLSIKDKIFALGGKAAGSSAMGTLKNPKEANFHFSLPESNFSELELFLGTFGPVRFATEKAPRVMPEGQIRIILTVKDAATDEGTSETP